MSTITLAAPTTAPRPKLWTCVDFHRFGDLGAFEGRGAMLIDGVILEEGPMNPPHALALELTETAIRAAFGAGWRVRVQLPLVLGQHTDPEPDLALVAGSARGAVGHPTHADLVVEISDTSLDFDVGEKRRLYARAGIPEYWVVDINGRRLLTYREPRQGDYALRQAFGANESVAPLAGSAAVLVADLLP